MKRDLLVALAIVVIGLAILWGPEYLGSPPARRVPVDSGSPPDDVAPQPSAPSARAASAPRQVEPPCRIESYTWANRVNQGAFADVKIPAGFERVRVVAHDALGRFIGSKVVPVNGDGSLEAVFPRFCNTTNMTIRVNCHPENRLPTDYDDDP